MHPFKIIDYTDSSNIPYNTIHTNRTTNNKPQIFGNLPKLSKPVYKLFSFIFVHIFNGDGELVYNEINSRMSFINNIEYQIGLFNPIILQIFLYTCLLYTSPIPRD